MMYSVTISRQNKQLIRSISFNNADIYYIELDGINNYENIDSMINQLKNEMNQIVGTEYFALSYIQKLWTEV